MKYNRILLKLSGESLQGAQGYGLSTDVLHSYAAQIRQAVEAGVQVAVADLREASDRYVKRNLYAIYACEVLCNMERL